MRGSYSSRSSIVVLCLSKSSYDSNRWQICFFKSPYGIGCLIATTLFFFSLRMLAIRRVVGLFPDPVLTAQTAMIGTSEGSIVLQGPINLKSAPLLSTIEARFIT